MNKYTFTVKEAIAKYNKNNPTLKQKNGIILAKELGMRQSYLSQLGKKYKNNVINTIYDVVFLPKSKEDIKKNWELYKDANKHTQNIEKIRLNLECEIYDIVIKTKP